MSNAGDPEYLRALVNGPGNQLRQRLDAQMEAQRRFLAEQDAAHEAALESIAERNAEVEEQRLATVAREEEQLQVNRETATTLAEMKAAAEAAGVEDARRHRREMVLLVASVLIALLSLIVAVVAVMRP